MKPPLRETSASAFDLEAYVDIGTLARFLSEIAAAVRRGELSLGLESSPVVLPIGDRVAFELSLAQGDGDAVHIELSWRRADRTGEERLVISR